MTGHDRLDEGRLLFGGSMLIIPAEMVFALAGIVRDDTTLVTVASSMATAGSGSLLLAARPINGSG